MHKDKNQDKDRCLSVTLVGLGPTTHSQETEEDDRLAMGCFLNQKSHFHTWSVHPEIKKNKGMVLLDTILHSDQRLSPKKLQQTDWQQGPFWFARNIFT